MTIELTKCELCGGTGTLLLNRSWFKGDGMRRERCGICGGTGLGEYRPADREWVRSQRERRARLANAVRRRGHAVNRALTQTFR